MTLTKINEMIWECSREDCAIDNNSQIQDTFEAVEELVTSLQPTPFEDIRLYHENIIKGEVLQMSQHEKGTLVQVLIKHEVK